MRKLQLANRKFGRWTVIKEAENKGRHRAWICKCDCGNEKDVYQDHLVSGKSQSCGCFRTEKVSVVMREIKTKHNWYGTRLYKAWQSMKMRCTNPNNHNYENYGGRGIKLCEEWREFTPFKEWALNNGYDDTLTIDRIDVNGNYEPSNCRWTTIAVQNNNKRNNRFVTYNGRTQTVSQWAEELNINRDTIYTRLNRGWSEERALQC